MNDKYIYLTQKYGKEYGINPLVLQALIIIESDGNTWATRYEKNWRWFLNPLKYAKLVRTTKKTERVHQATSWGLAQVMGTVARELGFKDDLPQLCDPNIGIKYGAKKLKSCLDKYKVLTKALAAYNAGSPTNVGLLYAEKVLSKTDDLINLQNP